MTDSVQPIPVYRPTFLTDGGEFRGSLIESPANIFYQKVNASRATLNRMQFQWRSVSDNLLLSPTCMLRFQLRISSPTVWSQIRSYMSLHGITSSVADVENAAVYTNAAASGNNEQAIRTRVPCLVFADGDAFSSVCSSMNLIFNGTSISLNRCNRFWRDWTRTQVACEDVARIYKSAGGSYDKYDQTPCVVGSVAGHLATSQVGITQDSGISERSKALYAQSYDGKVSDMKSGAFQGAPVGRVIQVSFPVPLPPFNPWRGYSLPASCPYKSCPLAIPHLSSGSLDFLMEDFTKAFIRRLGTADAATGVAAANHISQGVHAGPVEMEIVDGETYLELKYFRLSHTRSLKESYRFAIWQSQTFLGEDPPKDPTEAKGFARYGAEGDPKSLVAMVPVGKDNVTATTPSASTISSDRSGKSWSIQFDTLNLAQIPSFLLISCPKLGDSYTMECDSTFAHNAQTVPNCVRNLSRNLSIKSIRIIVNSARGASEKSADVKGNYIDAERLWQMTKENCNSKYFAEGGFRAWRDHGCAVLLSSPQFAPGLQACDGVAYPVQIQIEMEVENRSVDVCALSILEAQGANLGGENAGSFENLGGKNCHRLQPDFIRAQAQCTAFYQKVVLATTETSASVNAMNYPLSSAERLLNSAGSRF